MKRKRAFTLLLSFCMITIMIAGFLMTACDSSNQNAPTEITLSETNISIAPGETHQLYATVSPSDDNAKISWSSSNKNVVTVDNNGIVTGVATGTGVVRATTENNLVASCTVTVVSAVGSLEVYVTARKGLQASTKAEADANAKIILIPENLESFPSDFDFYNDFSSYGIFTGKADTDGKKIFNNIPVGKYRAIIQSEKADYSTENKLELTNIDGPTQKGEEMIKKIFGDDLYQKLQVLKTQMHNDSMTEYAMLSASISYGLTSGKSVEIKKGLTESLNVESWGM